MSPEKPTDDLLNIEHPATGKKWELPVEDGCLRAVQLRQIPLGQTDLGLMSYDPSLLNTASCRSAITFIDGDAGILDYRGYSIEDLAESVSYPEVCYLILKGELPNRKELAAFQAELAEEAVLPAYLLELFASFPDEMHPMTMLASGLAALGAKYPESEKVLDEENRNKQIIRLLAKTPALAALAWRRTQSDSPVGPDPEKGFIVSFLRMLLGKPGEDFEVEESFARAMDALLTLHADHEQNCSTNAVRVVASSHVNPYSAVAAGCFALHGPLHGGANQAVLEMLEEIGTVEAIPAFLEACKCGDRRLMGFGHRVYKNYDPRAKVISGLVDSVLDAGQPDPRLEIARALEAAAREDDYFVSRKLFPNVDFYSGILYSAMGFPASMFTVFFAVGRMVGWLAHWDEMLRDSEQKIARPRQIYTGHSRREVPPMDKR
ncbi:MAG TPA: citrate synthase [Planctomycetota bacterium]|nr:citrate synthase [Planctomycetota bacterium]MDP7246453.1 citrate synthase [Planctomycetota bacterium]HJM39078.1 citrate synthase [Planctomycetota bacterium]